MRRRDKTPEVHTFPLHFGGIPSEYAGPGAAVHLIPVPHGLSSGFRANVGKGPEAIIQASRNMELFDSELGAETYTIGIHTAQEVEPNVNSPQDDANVIEAVAAGAFRRRKFPVLLGGDHAISLGAVRAAKKRFKDLGFLMFDAHPDLFDVYLGTKFAHASIARRVHDLGVPIALVGIRTAAKSEAAFIKKANIPVVRPRELLSNPGLLEEALSRLPKRIYLSIDIDVLDPALMPAVNYPEPGGLGWYELMDALETVVRRKKVVAMDVVELCPIPGNPGPDFVAAKLIYRALGLIFRDKLSAQ
jgi:agmatinase